MGVDSPALRPLVLVLGTADWDQPIATNQHYATRELAREFDVIFVESMGLRRPRLSRRDLGRVWRRIRRQRSAAVPDSVRAVPDGLTVVSPLVLPFHGRLAAVANRRLLDRALSAHSRLGVAFFLLTYTPTTYGWERRAARTLYHCVDLLGELPGVSRRVVHRAERALAATGAQAAASSAAVGDALMSRGFQRVLDWPNVADSEVFLAKWAESRVPNTACFAGNLTVAKIDFTLLEEVLDAGIELHLAGPIAEGGEPSAHLVQRLVDRGAKYHGRLGLDALAVLLGSSMVGLAPYSLNSYTLGISPLKVYEHLAAGNAVVSTAVPSVIAREGHVVVAGSHAEFVSQVVAFAREPMTPSALEARRAIAELHSWSGRGAELRGVFRGAVAE